MLTAEDDLQSQTVSKDSKRKDATRRKICLLGDGAIGKTSFLAVVAGSAFPETYIPTVFENVLLDINVDDKPVELAVWDTAGQDDYARLRPLSYPDTDAFIVCFAIDEVSSFNNVETKWLPEIQHYCPHAPVLLMGLRKDVRKQHDLEHCLPWGAGHELEATQKVKKYLECSSVQNDGTKEVLETVARLALMPLPKRKRGQCSLL